MVTGVDRFREHFAGHDHQYVLIGGAACALIMDEAGLDFRVTKDLDIVLIVEALDPAFSDRFMAFIDAGGYEVRERSEGDRILYRFHKPATDDFPAMLELFSSRPEGLPAVGGSHLTRLPIGEAAASLSAILLDEDYYAFLKTNVRALDGIPVLDEAGIIPFKARAWRDLSQRREAGEKIDGKDVSKHRRDVVRLLQVITTDAVYQLPPIVRTDMVAFVDALEVDEAFDPKQFDVPMTRAVVVDRLRAAYAL